VKKHAEGRDASPRPALAPSLFLHPLFAGQPCRNASRTWEQQPSSTLACRTLAKTAMSRPLPPEILDRIVDQLHDDLATLKACCLVSKSWIQRAQKHLFTSLSFNALTPALEFWKMSFPDPANSPAHHIQTLSICHPHLIRAVDTILTFCNVRRLDVFARGSKNPWISLLPLHGSFPILRSLYLSFDSLPDSVILDFICSFPLLEDLTLDCVGYGNRVQRWDAPPTTPRLSGTLQIETGFRGTRSIIRRLLDLPNGIHFSKINVPWLSEEDVRSTADLVSGCADTLQSIDIISGMVPSLSPPSL